MEILGALRVLTRLIFSPFAALVGYIFILFFSIYAVFVDATTFPPKDNKEISNKYVLKAVNERITRFISSGGEIVECKQNTCISLFNQKQVGNLTKEGFYLLYPVDNKLSNEELISLVNDVKEMLSQ